MNEKPIVDPKRTGLKARAVVFTDEEFGGYAEPGGIEVKDGYIICACPGCGRTAGMSVGEQKPNSSPSWGVAGGSLADVTTLSLTPSISCVGCCHWHGFLTKGVFLSC